MARNAENVSIWRRHHGIWVKSVVPKHNETCQSAKRVHNSLCVFNIHLNYWMHSTIWEILRIFMLSIYAAVNTIYRTFTSEDSHVWKGNSDANCRSIVNTIMTRFKCCLSSWYYSISNESAYHKNIDQTSKSQRYFMMTSSNGNIFRVTGPFCREFTGHRWIPLTKASDAELRCFLWSAPE